MLYYIPPQLYICFVSWSSEMSVLIHTHVLITLKFTESNIASSLTHTHTSRNSVSLICAHLRKKAEVHIGSGISPALCWKHILIPHCCKKSFCLRVLEDWCINICTLLLDHKIVDFLKTFVSTTVK